MEDLEYTTCLQFATELDEEPLPREPRRRVELCPWVLQDEGEA